MLLNVYEYDDGCNNPETAVILSPQTVALVDVLKTINTVIISNRS